MVAGSPDLPVLHLERSRTARAFVAGENLWDRELKQIYRLLSQHLRALKQESDESQGGLDPEKLPVLSIAIFGTYGSGKTSLLKTLVSEVNGGRLPEELEELKTRLFSLPVIEPNLLAKDEHFLYAFLATALEEDLKRPGRRDRQSHALTPVQQVFQEVSEYLQVIDEVEKPQEYDPLGLSLERLERHTSGLLLREKLRELLDRLADDLVISQEKNSVVLLPVDDADLSLESLTATLDTFHRYLQHPRLVPVFTFTGRLAEELLQVHFARNLTVKESQRLSRHTSISPPMVEDLAVQYMVKLFPIRNRVRLGPAPARVQGAFYRAQRAGRAKASDQEKKVWDLLETASNLLFGHPEWPMAPRVRLSLRPSTLRRQLQVLDAMHDSRVGDLLALREREEEEKNRRKNREEPPVTWVEIFDTAAWSLLNVHRDVFRELQFHIEELYSLTPRNLSRAVLTSVLSLDLETRRELMQRWRFQVEDRRGQILSLLALNAFRPQLDLEREEVSGDDPDAVRARLEQKIREIRVSERREQAASGAGEDLLSFSAMKGMFWFLDLWIGFYLPQILARNRPNDIVERDPELGSVRGIGWNLRSGPVTAVSEVLSNREISATGMMRLEPKEFSEKVVEGSIGWETSLAIHLWCFYGYKRGEPWVAVSFWRGLGLLGQLLEDYERLRIFPASVERDHLYRIEALIEKHCAAAKIPGSFQEGTMSLGRWRPEEHAEAIRKLGQDVKEWIDRHGQARVRPMARTPSSRGDSAPDEGPFFRKAFEQSFIRRLHGEYLLGEFWPELGGAYLEGLSQEEKVQVEERSGEVPWNAWAALEKWAKVLDDYWGPRADQAPENSGNGGPAGHDGSLPLRNMLRSCPLLWPFLGVLAERTSSDLWLREDLKRAFENLSRGSRHPAAEAGEAS